MNKFTVNGKEYPVSVTIGKARKIKEATGVDLLGSLEDLSKALSDTDIMLKVLHCYVDMTYEEWENTATMAILDEAGQALLAALIESMPPAQKKMMTKIEQKYTEKQENAISLIEAEIAKL